MHTLRFWLAALAACTALLAYGQTPASQSEPTLTDIHYKTGPGLDAYEQDYCRLDVYLPKAEAGFPTLVWFHGGGLKSGNKERVDVQKVARSLANAGIAVVVPNYRLSPKAKYPAYIQDAAAAFAWTHANIASHGGAPNKIFVGGHSAGGYLTFMLGLDPEYLAAFHLQPSDIAGLIPVSGQVMTHYTVREERGIARQTITADTAAPVYFIKKDAPPMLVLYADKDMAGRAEENIYMVAMLKDAKHPDVTGLLITNRTHGSVASKIANDDDEGRLAVIEFIKRISSTR